MSRVSKDIILMEEVRTRCAGRCVPLYTPAAYSMTWGLGHALQMLGYLTESLETRSVPPEPVEQNGRALFDRLQIGDLASELGRRIHDLAKNMSGARHEFQVGVARAVLPHRHASLTTSACRSCAR